MTNDTALTRQRAAAAATDSVDTDLQQMSDDGCPHNSDPPLGDSGIGIGVAEWQRDDGYDPGMGVGDEWGGLLYPLPGLRGDPGLYAPS